MEDQDAPIEELRAENERLKRELQNWKAAAELVGEGEADFPWPKDKDLTGKFLIQCNDAFAWASADDQPADISDAPMLLKLHQDGDMFTLIEWCQGQRGGPEKAPFQVPMQEAIAKARGGEGE